VALGRPTAVHFAAIHCTCWNRIVSYLFAVN